MFVVMSTYLVPSEEMGEWIPAYVDWLKEQHDAGIFISSGCNLERTGGALLVNAMDLAVLQQILARSPYSQAGVATYQVTEITNPVDAY